MRATPAECTIAKASRRAMMGSFFILTVVVVCGKVTIFCVNICDKRGEKPLILWCFCSVRGEGLAGLVCFEPV